MEFESIEPAVLTALAEMANKEETRIQNPYLKALLARLSRLSLELKAALENEGALARNQADRGSDDQNCDSTASK